jgi:hypothetical protein
VDGTLPMNHQITYMLQEIFNLIPDVTEPAFVKSVNVNTNDQVRIFFVALLFFF